MEDAAVAPVAQEIGPGREDGPVEGEPAIAASGAEFGDVAAEPAVLGAGGQEHLQLFAHHILKAQVRPLGKETEGEPERGGNRFRALEPVQQKGVTQGGVKPE